MKPQSECVGAKLDFELPGIQSKNRPEAPPGERYRGRAAAPRVGATQLSEKVGSREQRLCFTSGTETQSADAVSLLK